jgi:hypothetical protein
VKIDEIIKILENKLANLYNLKNLALSNGDLESIIKLESSIQETEESLFILKNK